jgi:hypothetical protein
LRRFVRAMLRNVRKETTALTPIDIGLALLPRTSVEAVSTRRNCAGGIRFGLRMR